MNCGDIGDLFSEIYDNENAALADEFNSHISACPSCAAEFNEFCRLMKEVRSLPEPEIPSDLHEVLMKRVKSHAASEKKRHTRASFTRYVLAAAASVVVTVILLFGGFEDLVTPYVPHEPAIRAVEGEIETEAPIGRIDIMPMDAVITHEDLPAEPGASALGGTGSRALVFALVFSIIPLGAGLAAVIISFFRQSEKSE